MKFSLPLLASLAGLGSAYINGFDVSHYQSSIDWSAAYKTGGLRFVMIKATEGTTYKDPKFSSHYTGATKAGFIRGGYHFARLEASAATQAQFFFDNGGGWTGDGITLPGMLDLEQSCDGYSNAAVVKWIQTFVDKYHSLSGRYPILYFSPSWWKECTGDSTAFSKTCPLDLASWNSKIGPIPGGWPFETFWQYADTNKYGGDSDHFNGDAAGLHKLATG